MLDTPKQIDSGLEPYRQNFALIQCEIVRWS